MSSTYSFVFYGPFVTVRASGGHLATFRVPRDCRSFAAFENAFHSCRPLGQYRLGDDVTDELAYVDGYYDRCEIHELDDVCQLRDYLRAVHRATQATGRMQGAALDHADSLASVRAEHATS